MPTTRDLYLARHGQADPTTTNLTDIGRQQADLLGRRLSRSEPHTLWHGPSPRTTQTAHQALTHLPGLTATPAPEADDHIPHLPTRDELPPRHTEQILAFLSHLSPQDHAPHLAARALERFTGPAQGSHPRREVVITHAYLIAYLIAHALDAPPWRWISIPVAHAALTVIRYRPHAPASVVVLNDTAHLTDPLRWTDLPTWRP
ncbi:histidine phosphatase family protein [Nocardiopsis sp. NPDC006832]|uniref:histidine phosphatase family protein n=1 Tax=Nocardiopsis sp. NPDC006832 TaxID=3157188 RepID=UPI0033F79615